MLHAHAQHPEGAAVQDTELHEWYTADEVQVPGKLVWGQQRFIPKPRRGPLKRKLKQGLVRIVYAVVDCLSLHGDSGESFGCCCRCSPCSTACAGAKGAGADVACVGNNPLIIRHDSSAAQALTNHCMLVCARALSGSWVTCEVAVETAGI